MATTAPRRHLPPKTSSIHPVLTVILHQKTDTAPFHLFYLRRHFFRHSCIVVKPNREPTLCSPFATTLHSLFLVKNNNKKNHSNRTARYSLEVCLILFGDNHVVRRTKYQRNQGSDEGRRQVALFPLSTVPFGSYPRRLQTLLDLNHLVWTCTLKGVG